MRTARMLLPLLVVLPLLACGRSGGVGDSCGGGACSDGLSCQKGFPNGFCSQSCTAEGEGGGCPAETLCTRQLDSLLCAPVCASQSDCRVSYACNGVSDTNQKACQVQP